MNGTLSYDVVIVGAGPVGLTAALLLAQRNVKVVVIESLPQLADTPRAIVYLPQTIGLLEDAGILDQVKAEGHVVHSPPCWRTTSDMKLQAQFDFSALQDTDLPLPRHRVAILMGQQVLGRIVLDRLKAFNVSILFSHTITDITQTDSSVSINAYPNDTPTVPITLTSAYLLACDGGRSFVRRQLAIPFEGYTHDLTFMSINLRYPAAEAHELNDANFLLDPRPATSNPGASDFGVFIRTGKDGVWRCAYGEDPALSEDEVRAHIPAKLKRMLPGHPEPEEYTVLLAAPYKVHQRAAATFVQGRVVLAGDAAHLNNPIGGLGLCTGLLDVHTAAVALAAAVKETDATAATALLDEYNTNRRLAFLKATNPLSTTNLRRLREQSEEADRELRGEFFEKMNSDPAFQRRVMLEMNGIATGAPGFETVTRLMREREGLV